LRLNPISAGYANIAASRRTPFVVAALSKARALGARTAYVTCTPRAEFTLDVDVAICPVVGPEAIMGSTRMKSGTAQKLVLNMITTAAFVRMGKAYENMMVDLQLTNRKLLERAKGYLMRVKRLSEDEAFKLIQRQSMDLRKSMREIAEAILLAGDIEERAERRRD